MKKYLIQSIHRASAITVGFSLVATTAYATAEPLLAHGATTQAVTVTLNVTSGVALTVDSNTAEMSTNLGVAQNTAVGTTTFTAETNDTLGYTLNVEASTNPAMKSGANSIANFPTGTPETWTTGLPSNGAVFGYSAIGNDTTGSGYWGTGSNCSNGATSTISTTLKYTGFTTSPTTVSSNTGTTTPTGDSTTLCYAVQQNNFYIPSGTYTATITGTALAN